MRCDTPLDPHLLAIEPDTIPDGAAWESPTSSGEEERIGLLRAPVSRADPVKGGVKLLGH